MKKQTKQKCEHYNSQCDKCFLLANTEYKCFGENCWLLKCKLNTPQKLALIKEINKKMKIFGKI